MSALPQPEPPAPGVMARAFELVAADFARFETTLEHVLAPQKPYLTGSEYEIYRRGKKIRPLLLLLSARLTSNGDGEPLPERAIRAAVSLEMLHVATLIHDDIIDDAPLRRGVPSIHAERGSDVALLIGDMQFVQAVRCFAAAVEVPEDMALVLMVLDVGFAICCGELDELATDPRWSVERLRRRYLKTIDRKTAVLFELACHSGAALLRARKRQVWKIGRYGRLAGRAFQIMDDLSDFVAAEERAGKAIGMDLARRRLTLPIIEALQELPAGSALHEIMRAPANCEPDSPLLAAAISDVTATHAFTTTYARARKYAVEVVECLDGFPDTSYRRALEDLAYSIVDAG